MSLSSRRGCTWRHARSRPFGGGWWPFAALALYSLALVLAEVVGSVELARHLCTDIVGPVRFYAVNTSLSAGLLLGGALVLAFTAAVGADLPACERRFLRWQALILLYLGLDDRFLFHETVGVWLQVEDALVLGAVGVLEVVLLVRYGAFATRSPRARAFVFAAAVMFAVMSAIDALAKDAQGWPRLTLEDVAKTWGAAFLFAFAWEVGTADLRALRLRAAERAA